MKRARSALQEVSCVDEAEVSLEAEEARVSYDPDSCASAELVAAIDDAGFTASVEE